ncbi:putative aquaglyceroporin [Aspergillus heteromorphus CBS 117.55]|uniref:Putative aquaglyceroporin n=1 Tax=Aspergillus heteromorphus CBS 117.55 TaxID=1448321 RepID=A0A317WJZ1_9EURO|nr:putative aquaglyceroporin [Aspergillus heteromorphus CBS 117.55]PWY86766.1 putative aquaglyceroporin [Aspergillus heteromorphus CBS 117.55]
MPRNKSHLTQGTGASRSKSYRSQPPASLRNQSHGSQPPFSLAGNNPYYAPTPQHGAYISPDYESLNPQYGQEQDEGPVWSLAQPLPHVVRDGMRFGALPEDRKEEQAEQGRERPPPASGEPPTDMPQPAETRGFFNQWCKVRHYLREPLAEWLGTTVAITLGLCATLSLYTSQGQAGSWMSVSAAWGFSFMTAIYVAGGISGAHLNPAITISLSVWRGFPARRCAVYILAQIIGGITAGGFAYAIYHDAIMNLSTETNLPQNESAASEALITLPKQFVSPATAFFNEFLGSAILVGAIMALGDDSNAPPGAGMQSFIIGIIISILILALGYNSGGAFNGPRDFGPRLVCVMAGWGGHLFKEYHAWWVWGPWVADISGGLCGAFIYDLTIFTGGESPINYPPRRRKRAFLIKEKNLRSKFRLGRRKIGDLERAVDENQE